ncbi:MAG: hypothetical protein HC824_03865 [Synechococcales cyanobacterium RM1_1_8]|nr:hypothetical protein [Synechococcales cyanobacterium RM1_1_8]
MTDGARCGLGYCARLLGEVYRGLGGAVRGLGSAIFEGFHQGRATGFGRCLGLACDFGNLFEQAADGGLRGWGTAGGCGIWGGIGHGDRSWAKQTIANIALK